MKPFPFSGLILLLAVSGVSASSPSPYQGMQERPIKALSAQQIEGYLAGAGMGQAMAGELNHYPGPKHVLELADELELNKDQRRRTEELFASMQKRAQQLGRELVDRERDLDQAFAGGQIDEEQLQGLLAAIAKVQQALRFAHLQAHLQQKEILSRHQVMVYDRLRGYGGGGHQHQHQGH